MKPRGFEQDGRFFVQWPAYGFSRGEVQEFESQEAAQAAMDRAPITGCDTSVMLARQPDGYWIHNSRHCGFQPIVR